MKSLHAPPRAKPRLAGNEETWTTLMAKFPPEDHGVVSAVAAAPEYH